VLPLGFRIEPVYRAEDVFRIFIRSAGGGFDFAAQKGVVVYNYGLISEGVEVFRSLEDARRGFREYTGFNWDPQRRYKEVGNMEYSEFYEQCDVFEGEINGE
jgi:hypothetical protein